MYRSGLDGWERTSHLILEGLGWDAERTVGGAEGDFEQDSGVGRNFKLFGISEFEKVWLLLTSLFDE